MLQIGHAEFIFQQLNAMPHFSLVLSQNLISVSLETRLGDSREKDEIPFIEAIWRAYYPP